MPKRKSASSRTTAKEEKRWREGKIKQYSPEWVRFMMGRYHGYYLLQGSEKSRGWGNFAKTKSAKTAGQLVRVLGFRSMIPAGHDDDRAFIGSRTLADFTNY